MFVLNPAKTFMNIGTAGSMPKLVLDLFDEEKPREGQGIGERLHRPHGPAQGAGTSLRG